MATANKLWLLRAREDLPKHDNPWEPWYDKYFGFVIRADAESVARQKAQEHEGDETSNDRQPWIDAKYSTCVELTADGPVEVVLADFHAA